LDVLARQHVTTLFAVVLAMYSATLSRITGQRNFVIGAPVAGRNQVETENLVGFLVNTVVMPVALLGS
jgi:non-ribosomal peptide synthetase component F